MENKNDKYIKIAKMSQSHINEVFSLSRDISHLLVNYNVPYVSTISSLDLYILLECVEFLEHFGFNPLDDPITWSQIKKD